LITISLRGYASIVQPCAIKSSVIKRMPSSRNKYVYIVIFYYAKMRDKTCYVTNRAWMSMDDARIEAFLIISQK